MRAHLSDLISTALSRLPGDGQPAPGHLERTRQKSHGDFASNVALLLAKRLGRPPRELATELVAQLPDSPWVARVEIAGPGFINFHLVPAAYQALVPQILHEGRDFGRGRQGGRRILLEFVSANPTGPLHVGHGRGAAYGDAVARILRAAGYAVSCEYYVNDAGRQMDILAISVWMRYLDLCGEQVTLPAKGYRGDYIWDIAAGLHREFGNALQRDSDSVTGSLPADEEQQLDTLIQRARELLGPEYQTVHAAGMEVLVDDIRRDLKEFGVEFDRWFSERSLADSGEVARAAGLLRDNGYLYEKDGAWWFRSTDFGDEKDRVVVRENGQTTYFASDIAYHLDKLERGFDELIDIWGADHHGYIKRVQASLEAMGRDSAAFTVLLVQFAVLYRGREKVSMSTRGGDFVSLRELRQEVGNDAARFFYVLRKCEQHMDFDLDLAKSRSNDNPVYYIQYAHARICSVFRQHAEQSGDPGDLAAADYALLVEPHEMDLLNRLSRFPEVLESAASNREPHQIAYWLQELATDLHTYYNAHQFLVADPRLRAARLGLVEATRRMLASGLELLGVSAPETM